MHHVDLGITCLADLNALASTKMEQIEREQQRLDDGKLRLVQLIGGWTRTDVVLKKSFHLHLVTMNVQSSDLDVKLLQPLSRKVVEIEMIRTPAGVFEITLVVDELENYELSFSLRGVKVENNVVSLVPLHPSQVTHEVAEVIRDIALISSSVKDVSGLGDYSPSEISRLVVTKTNQITNEMKKIEKYKPRGAKVVGDSERHDAVVGRPFTFQNRYDKRETYRDRDQRL
eukprot:TRINITY_DN14525_c0_g1_i1.p1 TRINITY_DN14525_c0_g1~~TRINITY_DN14525_c0_g1_i1.p1  ORF type:complete len:243 (-),score=54.12 TRINITY_DN14525_c0_g1_i1:1004-1690(-)